MKIRQRVKLNDKIMINSNIQNIWDKKKWFLSILVWLFTE